MNKIFLSMLIAGLVCTTFSLRADEAAVMAPAPTTSTEATATKALQDEVAGWMVETGKIGKDFVEGIDKGEYAQSWTNGDQLFQHTITQDNWTKALSDNRAKLGKVKSRTLKEQKPAWDPHGLPKGAYMVVEFDTSFDNAPGTVELLTMRRGSDNKWRVLTYEVNKP